MTPPTTPSSAAPMTAKRTGSGSAASACPALVRARRAGSMPAVSQKGRTCAPVVSHGGE